MRIIIAAVGRLKQGPGKRARRALSQARAKTSAAPRLARHRNRRNPRKPRRRMPSAGAPKNRSRSPMSFPSGAVIVMLDERGDNLDSASSPATAARMARGRPAGGVLRHRRRRRTGAEACATAPNSSSPSAPPPGRINWCASCSWSRFTAPARSCPAIPITGLMAVGSANLARRVICSPNCDAAGASGSYSASHRAALQLLSFRRAGH